MTIDERINRIEHKVLGDNLNASGTMLMRVFNPAGDGTGTLWSIGFGLISEPKNIKNNFPHEITGKTIEEAVLNAEIFYGIEEDV